MRILLLKSALAVLLVVLSWSAIAERNNTKRDLVLEYLQYVGVIDSIDLQIETMRIEYEEYYWQIPHDFWDEPLVVDLFENYKVALLRGYVDVMEEGLSDEDLEFLVDFYASAEGQRVVSLGKQLDPLTVAATSEAGKEFTAAFTEMVENAIE